MGGWCVLAAVSGGPDSMALAQVLHGLSLLGGIAHVNYGLREAADSETEVVRSFAERLNVPFFLHLVKRAEDENRSVQLWARELRYKFFEEILHENRFSTCALGHHADDQVETILFRLLRSRSLHPLSGIPAERGQFIRPLLAVSKQEILDYCHELSIPFCEDESNLDSKYIRNQIRNVVLPVLREVNPRIRERLLEASVDLKAREEWFSKKMGLLASQCVNSQNGCVFLNTKRLHNLEPDLSLATFLGWWLDEEIGLEGNEIRTVLEGISAIPGAKWILKRGVLRREVNGWTWEPAPQQWDYPKKDGSSHILYVLSGIEPGVHTTEGWRIEGGSCTRAEWLNATGNDNGVVYLDAEKLRFPLRFREWRPEDKIKPLGLKGTKRVKDLIQEEQKRGTLDSSRQLVVEDAQGAIVYVSGCRISESVRVAPDSKIVFRMQITPTE